MDTSPNENKSSYIIEYFPLDSPQPRAVVVEGCMGVAEALAKFGVEHGQELVERVVTAHVAVL